MINQKKITSVFIIIGCMVLLASMAFYQNNKQKDGETQMLFAGQNLLEELHKSRLSESPTEGYLKNAAKYGSSREMLAVLDQKDATRKIQDLAERGLEKDVYSFLQGPRSWSMDAPWSGEWCEAVYGGNNFGTFGCGFCCMANIYSTLSEYECSPTQMLKFATKATFYDPTYETGACDWGNMKYTLRAAGMDCELYVKADSYKKFQAQIASSKSAVVLVCSEDDNAFWKNTSGHYVNIWLYNKSTDMVFLAEPGSPTNNRTWIPLSYVYKALKSTSKYQYLLVKDYDAANNKLGKRTIKQSWNRPS